MKITQAALSRLLGVSQATVSMAFNNSNKLPENTRQRIMKKANELGYLPNASARAVRTGNSGCISLLQNYLRDSFLPPTLINGIKSAVSDYDKRLNLIDLGSGHESLSIKEQLPRLLNRLSTDGLLIDFTYSIHNEVMEVISKAKLPFVYINHKAENNCLYPDNLDAGRIAVNYLKMLGHKRIAYLEMSLSNHYSVIDRQKGYYEAMNSSGFPTDGLTLVNEVAYEQRQREIEKWIDSFSEIPTAFFCYEAKEAIPLYAVLLKRGYCIPRDVSIIAVHDCVINDIGINMTTLVLPFYELGQAAVEALSRKIADSDVSIDAISFSPVLVPGNTTAPIL